MKHNIFNKLILCSLLMLAGLTSCNYLDIVPEEQATTDDAIKRRELTLGYLYSCYHDLNNYVPTTYTNEDAASTDEYVLVNKSNWNSNAYNTQNNQRSQETGGDWHWRYCGYDGIRTCYMFLEAVQKAPELTEEERATWSAEATFLIGYYHFMVLRKYGPCPIMDKAYDPNTTPAEMPGRSHFDAVTAFILQKIDDAMPLLKDRYSGGEWGRIDKVVAKAVRARVLLTAASPQWNGNTLYESGRMKWENYKGGWETPGYGKQLVNPNYDQQKWIDARDACEEALTFAKQQGLELYTKSDFSELDDLPASYTQEQKDFIKYILRMRYAVMSRANDTDKCQEQVWGLAQQGSSLWAGLPHKIIMDGDNIKAGGYNGMAPTLNAIKQFYTRNGKVPAEDNKYYDKSEWFQVAGENIIEKEPSFRGKLNADAIIKLNTNREPRFYAWIAFDGGEYGVQLTENKDNAAFILDMRDGNKQGRKEGNDDYSYTGYLCQKWAHPALRFTSSGGNNSDKYSAPTPLIRMAELYLNLAECEAWLGHTDAFLKAINPVRERAGVPALKESDITASKTATDWVRNERFVEFYSEGIRYYDVRRWMAGKEYFNGPYTGLNVAEVYNPSVSMFNQEKTINQYESVEWDDRLYLMPLYFNEVDKSDTMIQAPGY